MPSLFRFLPEVIHDKLKISCEQHHIHIKESNKNAKCKKSTLTFRGNIRLFSFSIDKKRDKEYACLFGGDPIFPFFDEKQVGVCKKNDAIVFLERRGKILILLIELKSSEKQNYLSQLLSGRNFCHFLLETIYIHRKIKKISPIFIGLRFLPSNQVPSHKNPNKSYRAKLNFRLHKKYDLKIIDWSCEEKFSINALFKSLNMD